MLVARRARSSICGIALSVIALVACGPSVKDTGGGGGDGGGNGGPHTLLSIGVTPTNPIVELDINTTGTQAFQVIGYYADDTTDDLTAQSSFTVANPVVGAMDGANLNIPAFGSAAANTSLVTASVNGFVGQAQITVVALRLTGSATDFFFVLPYQDPAGDQSKPLDFATTIPSLDVFFMMDTTGSMGPEIVNLQSSLKTTVIKQIQTAIPDTQFGVGAFEDFPINPYGETTSTCAQTDQPFKLRAAIGSDATTIQNAVNGLTTGTSPIGCGNDVPEAGIEALYQVATGNGLTGPSPTSVPANHTGVGGVAFRAGTMPVVVAITDATSHTPNETNTCGSSQVYTGAVAQVAHDRVDTKKALSDICARTVGIAPTGGGAACDGEAYLTDFATATGARVPPVAWDVGTRPNGCSEAQCCIGASGTGMAVDADGLCPLVFRVGSNGTGVGDSVATGITMLTRFATFDVTNMTSGGMTDLAGNPLPAPHTTADFIKAITPVGFTLPTTPPIPPAPTFDAMNFHKVTPGTGVSFTVNAFNDFVMQTDQAQFFQASIQVLADTCTPLDTRTVLILVPPTPLAIQ